MNILIKPRKNRYIIYAIIIALFSTIGMQISLLNINIEQIFKRLEYRSMLIYFIAILKKSISGKGETDLLYSIIGCGIFLLFLIIFSYKFSKREIVSATCLAILFGICRWIGVALLLATLNKFGVDQLILKVALFIYALIPVFPLYSILVGGDAFFSLMFLYFMIEVIWIFGTKGKIFYNKKFNGIMIITAFLLMAAKNQGLYVFCIFFIICLIYFRKYFRKVLISMLVPILCFQFIYVGMIFPICKVGVVGEQEKLSVCFQQTARYIKYYKDEVTKEEKNAINKVLDYEKIGNKYNPELADPVKETYKTSATSTDLNNYFSVWLKMGLKHPVEYIEAFIANTYAYYAPLLTTNRGLYLKLNSMKFYKKTRPWVKDTIPQTFINKNNCESPRRLKKIRKTVITFCKLTYHIPVINWLYNPGIITWLMFMAFFVFWTRKEYDSMITFIPLLLIFGICLLSPKNNNLRYIYPTCCMIPAMLAAAFGEKNPDL